MGVSILDQAQGAESRTAAHVPSFIVIGGGAFGARMAGQLLMAEAAGRLRTDAIVVVDREALGGASALGPHVTLAAADWEEWLAEPRGASAPEGDLVPYRWATPPPEGWLAREFRRARGAG